MPVSAKICGVSTIPTLAAAIAHGASDIGFMFYPPSPRHLDFDQAAALASDVPDQIGRVGVFVDPANEVVDRAVAAGRLTALQLHKTTPDRVAALRERTGLKVWATVAVRVHADLQVARSFDGAADLILYDAKTPDDAALPGGMGVRFDWGLLQSFRHPLPWALSGGLSADNVAEAVRQTGATLVDVSSGVESAPGIKDMDKIAAFLKACASL